MSEGEEKKPESARKKREMKKNKRNVDKGFPGKRMIIPGISVLSNGQRKGLDFHSFDYQSTRWITAT